MKNSNMASLFTIFCTCMIFVAAKHHFVKAGTQFKVGGDKLGWQEPSANNTDMYNQWAATNRFRVGDSLYFEFNRDSVLMVDKWDYYHCKTRNPIAAFDNGKAIIKLERPGSFYFISGAPNHCKNGQKLLLVVMSPSHPISHSPSSFISPPSPSPLSDSGVLVSVTFRSLCMAILATFFISVDFSV